MFGGSPSQVAAINHGTYFYHAAMEGLLRNDTNIHAGIRTTLSGPSDYENDGYCGFEIVEAREIDTIGSFQRRPPRDTPGTNSLRIGTDGIIQKIRDRVGTENPVYLSIDIDTLDPACKSPPGHPSIYRALRPSNSRTGNWHTRDWWLVHARVADDHSRPRRIELYRRRYCGGCAGLRYQCRAVDYVSDCFPC